MAPYILEEEIEISNPTVELVEHEKPEVFQPHDVQWQTPGVYIAERISDNPLVRYIGEKIESDYLQTIIVVDGDDEELVDKIFTVEQELYNKFKKLRFDIRLRIIPKDEDIDVIKKCTINLFDRDLF